jgi:hypothetical protein
MTKDNAIRKLLKQVAREIVAEMWVRTPKQAIESIGVIAKRVSLMIKRSGRAPGPLWRTMVELIHESKEACVKFLRKIAPIQGPLKPDDTFTAYELCMIHNGIDPSVVSTIPLGCLREKRPSICFDDEGQQLVIGNYEVKILADHDCICYQMDNPIERSRPSASEKFCIAIFVLLFGDLARKIAEAMDSGELKTIGNK